MFPTSRSVQYRDGCFRPFSALFYHLFHSDDGPPTTGQSFHYFYFSMSHPAHTYVVSHVTTLQYMCRVVLLYSTNTRVFAYIPTVHPPHSYSVPLTTICTPSHEIFIIIRTPKLSFPQSIIIPAAARSRIQYKYKDC